MLSLDVKAWVRDSPFSRALLWLLLGKVVVVVKRWRGGRFGVFFVQQRGEPEVFGR